MDELPHKLKIKFAMIVHDHLYKEVKFFKEKERNFIVWITIMLRPINIDNEKYIFKEGEEITESKPYSL